jgi:midasin
VQKLTHDEQIRTNEFQAMTDKLLPIITFWWNLFQLVSQNPLDEAVFQVYLNVGQRMLKSGSVHTESSTQMMKHIAKQFEGFHAQTKMTSGLSMELIWNLCRPSVMPTMQRLEKLWQLEQIAEQFDAVVWLMQAPVAELSAVRSSIVQAIALARRQDVDVESLHKVCLSTDNV